ncbi:IS1 family transposase, partial [Shigella sonnei]
MASVSISCPSCSATDGVVRSRHITACNKGNLFIARR